MDNSAQTDSFLYRSRSSSPSIRKLLSVTWRASHLYGSCLTYQFQSIGFSKDLFSRRVLYAEQTVRVCCFSRTQVYKTICLFGTELDNYFLTMNNFENLRDQSKQIKYICNRTTTVRNTDWSSDTGLQILLRRITCLFYHMYHHKQTMKICSSSLNEVCQTLAFAPEWFSMFCTFRQAAWFVIQCNSIK